MGAEVILLAVARGKINDFLENCAEKNPEKCTFCGLLPKIILAAYSKPYIRGGQDSFSKTKRAIDVKLTIF